MKTNHFLQIALRGLFLALFLAIVAWQWQQIVKAPQRFYPARISIPVAPGETRVVGRSELAANQADLNHLRLRRTQDGRWWIANASETRVVEITRDGREELLRTAVLDAHTRFSVGGKVFQIISIDNHLLRFRDPTGTGWQFDGVNLRQADGRAPVACPAESSLDIPKNFLKRQLRAVAPFWNRVVPASMESLSMLEFGGAVSCDNRIALTDSARGTARIAKRGPDFVLNASADSARLVCLAPDAHGGCASRKSVHEHETALDGVSKMVVGRTLFELAILRDALILMPRQRIELFDEQATPPGVTWEFDSASPWRWPFALSPRMVLAAAAFLATFFGAWLTFRKSAVPAGRALIWSVSLVTSLLALLVLACFIKLGVSLTAIQWPFSVGPWPTAGLWFGAVLLLWVLIQVRKGAMPARSAFTLSTSLLAIAVALLAATQGTTLGIGWTIALESCGLLAIIFLPQRSPLVWLTFALAGLLFAIGAATQLSLGLAGADTGSLRFFQTYEAKVAAGLIAWFALSVTLHVKRSLNFSFKWLEFAVKIMAVIALLALTAQALFGNEAGVGGFQPVELAKLALIIFSAYVLTGFLDWNHLKEDARLRLGAKFFLLIAFLVVAVIVLLSLVHDFSPLVLLAFWIGGMLMSWSLASRRAFGVILALALLACAAAGVAYVLSYSGLMMLLLPVGLLVVYLAGTLIKWSMTRGTLLGWILAVGLLCAAGAGIFQVHSVGDAALREMIRDSDRIAVWQRLDLHPHSGAQASLASAALEQGGMAGGDAAQPWRLPEVQNDMTPAYFLNRFGALGGVVLVALQVLYLACLLTLAWRSIARAESGDFRALWLARVGFFSVWSYAFFLAGHFVVSWGTNLQFLPVMGQPMPFLSVAGSLALLLLVPMQGVLASPCKRWV